MKKTIALVRFCDSFKGKWVVSNWSQVLYLGTYSSCNEVDHIFLVLHCWIMESALETSWKSGLQTNDETFPFFCRPTFDCLEHDKTTRGAAVAVPPGWSISSKEGGNLFSNVSTLENPLSSLFQVHFHDYFMSHLIHQCSTWFHKTCTWLSKICLLQLWGQHSPHPSFIWTPRY